MKAKVIARNLEEYGQIIDVVLNQYMGKYTDGKKQYAKEALSFDDIEEESIGDKEEVNELAFAIFCAKEGASKELTDPEGTLRKVRYAFAAADLFQSEIKLRKEQAEEEANSANAEEQDTDEPTTTHEDEPRTKEENLEIGFSDLLNQLGQ